MGGAVPGGEQQVYRVAWKVLPKAGALPKAPEASLIVLWFPATIAAARTSGLQTSRTLSLAGARCVADVIVVSDDRVTHDAFQVPLGQEAVILARPDGSVIGRVDPDAKGRLNVGAVDKLLNGEISAREKALKARLAAADKKAKAKDATAVEDYQAVWTERCLFPALGKRAAAALKKLNVTVAQADLKALGSEDLADPDVAGSHKQVEPLLLAGLKAEIAGRLPEAERAYTRAVELDPADPTALRFLAEFHRHQTGRWDLAGRLFNRILAQPADPVARAVAQHGLGKMTIHAGRFDAGLALFEASLASYPLPITYRNLAVFWFSELQGEKAAAYMRQALELDPEDRYNQIFAAVYLAAAGKTEEAVAIAKQNESVLEASYNLAAIYAQAGNRDKAMELLRRQFYTYEQHEPVRWMEMKEAREDYMFTSLHRDEGFIELTKNAKNAWMIGNEFCSPEQLEAITAPPGPRTML